MNLSPEQWQFAYRKLRDDVEQALINDDRIYTPTYKPYMEFLELNLVDVEDSSITREDLEDQGKYQELVGMILKWMREFNKV
jgi:hypothetical protein